MWRVNRASRPGLNPVGQAPLLQDGQPQGVDACHWLVTHDVPAQRFVSLGPEGR